MVLGGVRHEFLPALVGGLCLSHLAWCLAITPDVGLLCALVAGIALPSSPALSAQQVLVREAVQDEVSFLRAQDVRMVTTNVIMIASLPVAGLLAPALDATALWRVTRSRFGSPQLSSHQRSAGLPSVHCPPANESGRRCRWTVHAASPDPLFCARFWPPSAWRGSRSRQRESSSPSPSNLAPTL